MDEALDPEELTEWLQKLESELEQKYAEIRALTAVEEAQEPMIPAGLRAEIERGTQQRVDAFLGNSAASTETSPTLRSPSSTEHRALVKYCLMA